MPAAWRTPAARSPSAARTSDPDDFHRRGFVRDPLAVRISTAADAWAANEGVRPDERRGAVRRRLRRALLSVRQVVRLGEPLRADRHTPTPRRSPAAGLRSPHTPLDRAPRRHSRRRRRPRVAVTARNRPTHGTLAISMSPCRLCSSCENTLLDHASHALPAIATPPSSIDERKCGQIAPPARPRLSPRRRSRW